MYLSLSVEGDHRIYHIFAYVDRFVGGETNACYNAVDRHVEKGNGDRLALIHDSPVTSSKRYITYAELLDKVYYYFDILQDN